MNKNFDPYKFLFIRFKIIFNKDNLFVSKSKFVFLRNLLIFKTSIKIYMYVPFSNLSINNVFW